MAEKKTLDQKKAELKAKLEKAEKHAKAPATKRAFP